MMGAAAFRSETDTTLWTVRRRLDIAAQPAQPACVCDTIGVTAHTSFWEWRRSFVALKS